MLTEDILMPVHEKTIETLIEAVRKVSSSLDLDEVLDTIFDSVKELIDYSAAVIYVIDARSGEVSEFKTRGYLPESISEDFLATGAGIVGWVIRNRTGEIVDDVKRDARYVKVRAEPAPKWPLRLFAPTAASSVSSTLKPIVSAATRRATSNC